ncbi:MAG: hypothetical protein ACRENB_12210 [Gemmatimonadales bacterium]
MIRRFRQGHLRAIMVLAVVLPLILALAVAARRDPPVSPIPAELAQPAARP